MSPPTLDTSGNKASKEYVRYQPLPGFLTLQLLVDRWIIGRSVPMSEMNATALAEAFMYMVSFLTPVPASSVTPLLRQYLALLPANVSARIAADAAAFIGPGESFAPQTVEFAPFPITAYTNNDFYTTVSGVFSFFFTLVFLFPVSRLIRGLVMEKETRIREGMRMMGLSDLALTGSWFTSYALLYVAIAVAIAIVTSRNIFTHTGGGFIFLFFTLYGFSTISYCYLVSVFFSKAKTASTLGVMLFLGGFFPYFAVSDPTYTFASKAGSSILSPTAFGLGLDILCLYENNGQGLTSANAGLLENNFTMQGVLGFLIFDIIWMALLGWYVDNVLPSWLREFGVPRPWYFPVTASYWREVFGCSKGAAPQSQVAPTATRRIVAPWKARAGGSSPSGIAHLVGHTERLHNGPRADDSFFERPDANLTAKEQHGEAIVITGLRKEFDTPDGTKVAVDDVDMKLYTDQITVMLGHNGAGKTTLISMLTGLIAPTDGAINVFGRDLATNLAEVRRDLGVCPQHDVLWPELTAAEHLRLYCAIKGVPSGSVEAEVTRAIAQVGLTEKTNVLAGQLSGGQKRKLSLAIAFIGEVTECFGGVCSVRTRWYAPTNAALLLPLSCRRLKDCGAGRAHVGHGPLLSSSGVGGAAEPAVGPSDAARVACDG